MGIRFKHANTSIIYCIHFLGDFFVDQAASKHWLGILERLGIVFHYRNKEIGVLLEGSGKLYPIELKKTGRS